MKSYFRYLYLLLTLIFHFQSTTTYPSFYPQRQRSYLLCQLSAVSCKRSTAEVEDSADINIDEYLQMCIALNKPLRVCLNQPLHKNRHFLK